MHIYSIEVNHMHKKINTLICWGLAFIFLLQTSVFPTPMSPQPPNPEQTTLIKTQIPERIYISEQYGRIETPFKDISPASEEQQKQPTVILIKDAHCNYEAQSNISKILDTLVRDYKINLVGVEGASGLVNPGLLLASNPSKELVKKVTDEYMRQGYLTGAEMLSANTGKDPGFTIWGIEDLKLYLKDFQTFREAAGINPEGKKFTKLTTNCLTQFEDKIYNNKLQKFDTLVKNYKADKIQLTKFIKTLYANYGLPKKYKNLRLVLQSTKLEESIDFKKVEYERAELIKTLEKVIPKEALQALIKQSIFFKLGKMPAVEYYSYLEQYFDNNLDCRSITNLKKYIRLTKLNAKIEESYIFKELDDFIEKTYISLCQDPTSLDLYKSDRHTEILDKVMSLEATRDNLTYFKTNKPEFNPQQLTKIIKTESPTYSIPVPKDLTDPLFLENVEKNISIGDDFYKMAMERDSALVENMLNIMDKNKKDKAILVCGGFHAEGINKILQDKNIRTLTITPTITKFQENSREIYLKRMFDEDIDPVKMLASLGFENISPMSRLQENGLVKIPKALLDALNTLGIKETALDIDSLKKIAGELQSLYSQAITEGNTTLQKALEELAEQSKGALTLQKPAPAASPQLTPKTEEPGATLKAPGAKKVSRLNRFIINQLKKAVTPKKEETKKQIDEALSLIDKLSPYPDGKSISSDKIEIHTIDSKLFGIQKQKGKTDSKDLIYALGENGYYDSKGNLIKDGKLHIYVTPRFLNILLADPTMLAFLIDHEWQENILKKSHAKTSKRAWIFTDKEGMNPFYKFYLDQLIESGNLEEIMRILLSREHTDKNGKKFKEYAKKLFIGDRTVKTEELPPKAIELTDIYTSKIEKLNNKLFQKFIFDYLVPNKLIQDEEAWSLIKDFEKTGIIPAGLPIIPDNSNIILINGRIIILIGDKNQTSLDSELKIPSSIVGNLIFIAKGAYSKEEAERLLYKIDMLNAHLSDLQKAGEASSRYTFSEISETDFQASMKSVFAIADKMFPNLKANTDLFNISGIYHDKASVNANTLINLILNNTLTLFRRMIIDQELVEDIHNNIANLPINETTYNLLIKLHETTNSLITAAEQNKDSFTIQELINQIDTINSQLFIIQHLPIEILAYLNQDQMQDFLETVTSFQYSKISEKDFNTYLIQLFNNQNDLVANLKNRLRPRNILPTKFQAPIAVHTIYGQTFTLITQTTESSTVINTKNILRAQRLIKDFQIFNNTGELQETNADRMLNFLGVNSPDIRKKLITNWKNFILNPATEIDTILTEYGFNQETLRGNLIEYELNMAVAGDYTSVGRHVQGMDEIVSQILGSNATDIVIESQSVKEASSIAYHIQLMREGRLCKLGENFYELIASDNENELYEIQEIVKGKTFVVKQSDIEIIHMPSREEKLQTFTYNNSDYKIIKIENIETVIIDNGFGQPIRLPIKDGKINQIKTEQKPKNIKVICRLHMNPLTSPEEIETAKTVLEDAKNGHLDRSKIKAIAQKSKELREVIRKHELSKDDYQKIARIVRQLIEERNSFAEGMERIDGFICVSEKTKHMWLRYFPELKEKPFYVSKNEIMAKVYESTNNRTANNVNPEKINLLKQLGVENPEQKTAIAYVGRIEEKKGWLTLKEIILSLSDNPDYIFILGTACENVDGMVEDLVRFINGETQNPDGTYSRDPILSEKIDRLIENNQLKIVPDLAKFGYAINHSSSKTIEQNKQDLISAYNKIVSTRLAAFSQSDKIKKVFTANNIVINVPVQSAVDILVHPTYTEAYGLVIQEANAGGAYIIASHIGGIPEIIDTENDHLVHRILWNGSSAKEYWEVSYRGFIEMIKESLRTGRTKGQVLELIFPGIQTTKISLEENELYDILKQKQGHKVKIGETTYIIFSDYIVAEKERPDIRSEEEAFQTEAKSYVEIINNPNYKTKIKTARKRTPPLLQRNVAKTNEAYAEILATPTESVFTPLETKNLLSSWKAAQRTRAPPMNFNEIKQTLEKSKTPEEIKKQKALYPKLIKYLSQESYRIVEPEDYITLANEFLQEQLQPGATLKAPGSAGLDEDANTEKKHVYRQLRTLKEVPLKDENNALDTAIDLIFKRAPPENISREQLKQLLKLHILDSEQMGISRKEGAVTPKDLIYAIGKNKNGELHIYITQKLWNKILKENPLMLAFIIDHEYQENIANQSHRDASKRAWLFADPAGMNPFYRLYLEELAKNKQYTELQNIIASRKEDKSEEAVRFRNYARKLLLGKGITEETEIVRDILQKNNNGERPTVYTLYSAHTGSGIEAVADAFAKTPSEEGQKNVNMGLGIINPAIRSIMAKIRYRLQDEDGDLTKAEWEQYNNFCDSQFARFTPANLDGNEVIIINNHEYLGMIPMLKNLYPNLKIIWHCHLDLDKANPKVWDRFKGIVNQCDRVILQPRTYGQELIRQLGITAPVVFMAPAIIDPASERNKFLWEEELFEIDSREITEKIFSETEKGKLIDSPVTITMKKLTEDPYFLWMDRLDPQKAPEAAIEAFAAMWKKMSEKEKSKNPQLILAVHGLDVKNRMSAESLKLIRAKLQEIDPEITKNIHIVAIPSREDGTLDETFINYLQTGSFAGIHLPKREGFGLSIAEMMYKGKPVIGTNIGGVKTQIIDGFNGRLAESTENAGDIMLALLQDESKAKYLGERAQKYARENFLVSNLSLNYETIIASLYEKDQSKFQGALYSAELNEKFWENHFFEISADLQDSLLKAMEEGRTEEAWNIMQKITALNERTEYQLTGGGLLSPLVFEKLENTIYGKLKQGGGNISFTCISVPMGALNGISYEIANRFKYLFYYAVEDYMRNNKKEPTLQYSDDQGKNYGFAGTKMYLLGLDPSDLEFILGKIFEDCLRQAGLPEEKLKEFKIFAGQTSSEITQEMLDKFKAKQDVKKDIWDFIEKLQIQATGRAEAVEKNNILIQQRTDNKRKIYGVKATGDFIADKDEALQSDTVSKDIDEMGKNYIPEGIYAPGADAHGTLPRFSHSIGLLWIYYNTLNSAIESGTLSEKMKGHFFEILNKMLLNSVADPRYSKSDKFLYFKTLLSDGFTDYRNFLTELSKIFPEQLEQINNSILEVVMPKMGDEIWVYCRMKDGSIRPIFLELNKFNSYNKQVLPDFVDSFFHAILEKVHQLHGGQPLDEKQYLEFARLLATQLFDSKEGAKATPDKDYLIKSQEETIRGNTIKSQQLDTLQKGKERYLGTIRYQANEKVKINGQQHRLWMYTTKLKQQEIKVVVYNGRIYTANKKGDEEDITDLLTDEQIEQMQPVVTNLGAAVTTDRFGITGKNEYAISDLNTYQKVKMHKDLSDVIDIMTEQIAAKASEITGEKFTDKQKQNLSDKIKNILTGETKEIKLLDVLTPLLSDTDKYKEKMFQLLSEISAIIDSALKGNLKDKNLQLMAAVLDEIIKDLMEKEKPEAKTLRDKRYDLMRQGKTSEEALLESMKLLAQQKGVDPETIQSIFDLFKQGIDILAMDPALDPGQIDGSYFTLIDQLSTLTGIRQSSIMNAFKDSTGKVRISQGKIIEGSDLWKEAERLKQYNTQTENDNDISTIETNLWSSDFRSGTLVDDSKNKRTQYLSALDVVAKDTKKIISALKKTPAQSIAESKDPVGVILNIEDYITFNEDGTFSYKPGIETILKQLGNNIKIAFIAPQELMKKAEIALKATGRFGTNIFIATDATNAKSQLENSITEEKYRQNIVYLAPNEETARTGGIDKTIVISPESAFHASLTLAVLYARAGPKMINGKINPEVSRLVWHFLKLMDYKDDEIKTILEQFQKEGFFNVKLIRIKDTLKEFQNRKLYVETAA
jgi:trehalose synthase